MGGSTTTNDKSQNREMGLELKVVAKDLEFPKDEYEILEMWIDENKNLNPSIK